MYLSSCVRTARVHPAVNQGALSDSRGLTGPELSKHASRHSLRHPVTTVTWPFVLWSDARVPSGTRTSVRIRETAAPNAVQSVCRLGARECPSEATPLDKKRQPSTWLSLPLVQAGLRLERTAIWCPVRLQGLDKELSAKEQKHKGGAATSTGKYRVVQRHKWAP